MLDVVELLKPSALADAGLDGDVPCDARPVIAFDYYGGIYVVRYVCAACDGAVVGEIRQTTMQGNLAGMKAADEAARSSFTEAAMSGCPKMHGGDD